MTQDSVPEQRGGTYCILSPAPDLTPAAVSWPEEVCGRGGEVGGDLLGVVYCSGKAERVRFAANKFWF